jgi:hypothetical protein
MKKIIYCAVLAFVIASATIVAGISVYLIKNTSTALASLQQQTKQNVTLTVFFNLFNPPQEENLY